MKRIWILNAALWVLFWWVGFSLGESKANLELQEVRSMIKQSETWNSYRFRQNFRSERTLITMAEGEFSAVPSRSHFRITTPLINQNQSFTVDVFETEGEIFLHPLNNEEWFRTNFEHPAIKELSPLFHPFELWQELLSESNGVTKIVSEQKPGETTYRLKFNKKLDLPLYHLVLRDAENVAVELTFETQSGYFQEGMISAQFKQKDAMTDSNTFQYAMFFKDINRTQAVSLPDEAHQGKLVK